MQNILLLDQQLFLILNHLPHKMVFNYLALGLSGIGMAGIVWFLLGLILFLREERKHHWFFAPILLAGTLSYLITELILKNFIARPRPSAVVSAIIVGVQSTDFSFPSGHATIAFAMAVVLSKIESKWKWMFYLLAVAISFSRVYLGKHFPLDVLGGAMLGWFIGQISWWLSKHLNKRFKITA